MKQRTRDALFYVTAIVCCLLTVLLMANAFVKVDQNVAANASANDLPVILLDAGHGGEDGGAGENGVQEKDVNLAVALQLREFLEMSGFRVVMTRETDVSIHDDSASTIREKKVSDLHNRLKLIEQYPGCTFISIHQNQFEQSQYHGAQMFYSKNDERSKLLAEKLQQSFVSLLQPDNEREVKAATKDIYLLWNAQVPAVIVECGFLSNPEEAAKLKDPGYQKDLAFTIYTGFLRYWQEVGT